MEDRRNYYRILQIQPDASAEVVKASYRTLMGRLQVHPDFGGTHALATVVNFAYETLSNPRKRAEYDLRLLIRKRQADLLSGLQKGRPIHRLNPLGIQSANKDLKGPDPARASAFPKQDRRGMDRFEKTGKVSYAFRQFQDRRQGELLNLSLKGMRFISQEEIAPLTDIEIENPALSGRASVRYCTEKILHDRSAYLNGVYFIQVKFHRTRGTFLSVKA